MFDKAFLFNPSRFKIFILTRQFNPLIKLNWTDKGPIRKQIINEGPKISKRKGVKMKTIPNFTN